MSGYEPFPDPFSDPSITQATSKQNHQSSLDDYNPFATQNQKISEPAILPTSSDLSNGSIQTSLQPPNYTQTAVQNITQNELQKRQEELERKAAELAAKEEALKNLEGIVKPPNWPPIPSFCPFNPCLYQDINVEIKPEFQRIVRYAYYLWMSFVLVLILNMIGNLVILFYESNYAGFITSIFSTLIFSPASFLCWFRPLYKAFKNDSSFSFMIFFFVFFCQLVVSILNALGITSGSCGLLTLISHSGSSTFLILFLFFVTSVLMLYAGASVLMLIQIHSIYRSTGASIEKAQAEFAQGVFSNTHIQNAAQAAAQGAARHTMNNMFNGQTNQNGSGGLRF